MTIIGERTSRLFLWPFLFVGSAIFWCSCCIVVFWYLIGVECLDSVLEDSGTHGDKASESLPDKERTISRKTSGIVELESYVTTNGSL